MELGSVYSAIAVGLKGKKDISMCSHVVSDWIIDLIGSGIASKRCAFNSHGPVAATSCIGSEELFRFIDKNASVAIVPLMNALYQKQLGRIDLLTSIVDVKKIDASGDSVSIAESDYHLDGFDSKLNFSEAATHSRGGKSIVALRSTDDRGNSSIVITHKEGPEKIRSMLGSARYVVTEYGIAALFGKSIRERAVALIDIAHPRHRQALIEEAKEAGIMFPDQIYNVGHAMNYPRELEEQRTFRGGIETLFRPIRTSDEDMMRRLFYKISENAVYLRYLTSVKVMPHSKMQSYVNIDYRNTLSLVCVVQKKGIEHIIAECRYAGRPSDDIHEIAFIVDEEYQGRGIGSYMVDRIIAIARDRGIDKLTAYVLPENEKMSALFERAVVIPDMQYSEHEKEYTFDLTDSFADRERYDF
jgi:RimJ/RimL family protein N-acetyltransferase